MAGRARVRWGEPLFFGGSNRVSRCAARCSAGGFSLARPQQRETRFEPPLEAPGASRLSEDGDVAGRARVRWFEPLLSIRLFHFLHYARAREGKI